MNILSSLNHNLTIASIIVLLIKILVPCLDHFLFILFLLVSEKPVNNHKLVYSVAFVFFNASLGE